MTNTFFGASWSERLIFLLFIILWIVYGLLNQFNAINGVQFDPTTVVWSQELFKVIISVGLYFMQDGGANAFVKEAREQWTMLFWCK